MRPQRRCALILATAGAAVVSTGTVAAVAVPSTTTPTTTAPTTTMPPTTTPPPSTTAVPAPSSSGATTTTAIASPSSTDTTAAPSTTAATTTSTTIPDLLTGINWIQASYPSPCTDSPVQLVGGSAVQGGHRAVLDDVVPLDNASGLAVAFLSCRDGAMTTTQTTAVVVRVRPPAVVESVAERELGAAARIVDVDAPSFTVDSPATPPSSAALRRQTLRASATGFTVTDDEEVSPSPVALLNTPSVGSNADLVRRSVSPRALCFRWENVWMAAPEEPPGAAGPTEPSAELQTIRLALIHITGRWIEPTGVMNDQTAAVVAAYQESRGLAVDGVIGEETTNALAADLGCPDSGSFTMVLPTALGTRRFGSVADMVAATDRFARGGASGSPSFDQLFRDSHWDGRNAMFLGCYRWESPANGMSCSWSGPTPLQLVGLVEDPAAPGLTGFSILYAHSTAV